MSSVTLSTNLVARPKPSSNKTKAIVGCWTCKDRRVRCDRTLPTCSNCARLKHECQGYGVRLSWPKHGDRKRSLIGKPVTGFTKPTSRNARLHMIHTSYFEVDLYYYLVDLNNKRKGISCLPRPQELILPCAYVWRPAKLNAAERDLFIYFESIAFSSLATLSTLEGDLRNALIPMALSNDAVTSRAVLHAMLAVSSIHRAGLQVQSVEHKVAAIGALAASLKVGIKTMCEAAQHVAAGMLLCSFEIFQPLSDSNSHWPLYLTGVKDMISATKLETHLDQLDIAQLVQWASYHDCLAKISLLHWRQGEIRRALMIDIDVELRWQRDLCAAAFKLQPNIGVHNMILATVANAFDHLCNYEDRRITKNELQLEIEALETRLLGIPQFPITQSSCIKSKTSVLTELFRLATLIYIVRICESLFDGYRDIQALLDTAFRQIKHVDTCERLLPLFIIGCEARTDERRLLILDLICRTKERTHVRDTRCLEAALSVAWSQEDLHADEDINLDYMQKLNVIVSSSSKLPTFV
ncbi:hypothetical protein GGR57DRAFT_351109 [Xylariaceae sp. FL1272]|nr:hypothetical protein GGR57DRAFT_351109 [Xylariaceae sp. FL1272]